MGVNNGMMMFVGAIVPPLVSLTIHIPKAGIAAMTTHDFQFGLSVLPMTCAISTTIVLLLVRETYCRPQKEPTYL